MVAESWFMLRFPGCGLWSWPWHWPRAGSWCLGSGMPRRFPAKGQTCSRGSFVPTSSSGATNATARTARGNMIWRSTGPVACERGGFRGRPWCPASPKTASSWPPCGMKTICSCPRAVPSRQLRSYGPSSGGSSSAPLTRGPHHRLQSSSPRRPRGTRSSAGGSSGGACNRSSGRRCRRG